MTEGVVHDFASEIVAIARKRPLYGDKPAFTLSPFGLRLQRVKITGGEAFELCNEITRNKLLFHDITAAAEALLHLQLARTNIWQGYPTIRAHLRTHRLQNQVVFGPQKVGCRRGVDRRAAREPPF